MTEAADRKAGKAMGKMEETIVGLQDDVAIAKTPPANHFKPLWLLTAIIVVALISVGTFVAVGRLTKVQENSKAIDQSCEARNEALGVINEKFEQLNVLVVARLRDRPDGRPNPPDVLAAFEALRQPIPLKTCESLAVTEGQP